MPLKAISIITPSLNRADLLEDAIYSVQRQNYQNLEHIIVDGGSTDGSLELVKKYGYIRLFSGHDEGMYDALNKGLTLAGGEIIGFLNTDDLYSEGVFKAVEELFDQEDVFAVAGNAVVFTETDDGKRRVIKRYFPARSDLLECSTIGSNYFNAWFFRKAVFDRIGKFREDLPLGGDREFMLRFAFSGLNYVTLERLVYEYRQHPDSLTMGDNLQNREKSAADHIKITDIYLPNKTLPAPARALLLQVRTRVTLEMAVRFSKVLRFDKATRYMLVGLRYDPAWLFKLFGRIYQDLIH